MQDIIKNTFLGAVLDLWVTASSWFVSLFPAEIVGAIAWMMTPWAIPVWLLIGVAIGKWGWKIVVFAGVVLWAGISIGKGLGNKDSPGQFGELDHDPDIPAPVPSVQKRKVLFPNLFRRKGEPE